MDHRLSGPRLRVEPLQRTLGTVLAWNVFVLLGFLGAGGAAALWLRQMGLRRGAALAGGLAFALAPYLHTQWSAGHLLAVSAFIARTEASLIDAYALTWTPPSTPDKLL